MQESVNTLVLKYMHKDVHGDDTSGCQSVSKLFNITVMMGDTPCQPLETEGGKKEDKNSL